VPASYAGKLTKGAAPLAAKKHGYSLLSAVKFISLQNARYCIIKGKRSCRRIFLVLTKADMHLALTLKKAYEHPT
jgi:hypothetical protein